MIQRIPTPAALDPHATTAAAQAAPTSTGSLAKPPGMPWQQATNVRRSALERMRFFLEERYEKWRESSCGYGIFI